MGRAEEELVADYGFTFLRVFMIREHAITFQDRLSVADLDYIIKKSNKLGRMGKDVVSVREETDAEGTHIYFDVIGNHEQRGIH